MKIVFRCDASLPIGSGHVMRCLTLADELRGRGAEVLFVCRVQAGDLIPRIAALGFRVAPLPAAPVASSELTHPWLGVTGARDAAETLAALRDEGHIAWLVVDHYALDRSWESALRQRADRIMVIDDLADRPHDCDLLLDQNLYPDGERRYDALVAADCEKLLGPGFALLRPEFAAARSQLRPRDGQLRRLLLFFGGADAGNETAKALRAIMPLGLPGVSADVVIGGSNPQRAEIASLCAAWPGVDVHIDAGNMAELMARADLFIGAGGSTTWERCCLGVPSLVIAVADNQVATTSCCAERGVCLYLGESAQVGAEIIAAAITVLRHTPELLRAFSQAGLRLVDGKGVRRVASRLLPPEIVLRRATSADCDAVHAWRNHEETRRYIFNPEPVPLETHRDWFRRALQNPDRVMLIGESAGRPVGVLRYDLRGESALISVYLVPGGQGQGVGTQLIRAGSAWIRQHLPHIKVIDAEIMASNKASLRAFELAGFHEHHLTYQEELD